MREYPRLSRALIIAALLCWGIPAWLSAAPSATLSECGNPAPNLSAAGASARIAETTKPSEGPKPGTPADEEECE